jgi:DNA-binding CsgD family transcriptional regulator
MGSHIVPEVSGMQQFLMVFYVVFFSTGFMGGAALILLGIRVRSRLSRPLLLFQLLFLVGSGLLLVYFAAQQSGSLGGALEGILIAVIMSTNLAIWGIVIVIIRRVAPPRGNGKRNPALVAQILSLLVILKTAANIVVMVTAPATAAEDAWLLGTHMLVALAMASFGIVLRGPVNRKEPSAIHPLLKAYGTLAIVMAPLGFVEYALQSAGVPWLEEISLDHALYLAWNVVSMTAAIKLFRPENQAGGVLESVPEERVQALGLSPREVEIATMIGRGLTNKGIAEKLFISPGTVRTHIYNLYQKVGAGSRVELLNMLRG